MATLAIIGHWPELPVLPPSRNALSIDRRGLSERHSESAILMPNFSGMVKARETQFGLSDRSL